ncbi:MAG: hypothetical protein JNK05_34010 [Myxococcales bacterium]|nr:hypothetical protein [Myxococcales bacterium]
MDRPTIDALIHRVSSISDWGARVRVLVEQRTAMAEADWAEFEQELVIRAGLRDERAQTVLLALTEATAEPRARRRRGEVLSPEADWGTGRPLTLGERKTLARKPDRRLLEKALRDVHPDVVAEVLVNPRLTEADVARLCAAPHARPEVLARVLASPRWASRIRVRRAIALNPATPAPLALALVAMLDRQDLRELASNERIADAVRARALEVLRRLPPTPEPDPTRH